MPYVNSELAPSLKEFALQIRHLGEVSLRFHEVSVDAAKQYACLFEGNSLVVGVLCSAQITQDLIIESFLQDKGDKVRQLVEFKPRDENEPLDLIALGRFLGDVFVKPSLARKALEQAQSALEQHIAIIQQLTSTLEQLVAQYSQDQQRYQYLAPAIRLLQSYSNVMLLPIVLLDPKEELFALNPKLIKLTKNMKSGLKVIAHMRKKCA